MGLRATPAPPSTESSVQPSTSAAISACSPSAHGCAATAARSCVTAAGCGYRRRGAMSLWRRGGA